MSGNLKKIKINPNNKNKNPKKFSIIPPTTSCKIPSIIKERKY
jgi:hypothetical protein